MTSRVILYILFLVPSAGFSQFISGIVMDAKNNTPIESASVYFNNTTIGTTTNSKGEFSITYNEGIKSMLIISYLGYHKSVIRNYSPSKRYKVLLEEDINALDEVIITHDDGMPRSIKLSQFKKHFLGNSSNAKSCVIINEEDIVLRYFKDEKQLTATSVKPIRVKNKRLQYIISYDLMDFKVDYSYVNLETKQLYNKLVLYKGTSRYEDLEKSHKTRFRKNREKTYEGSSLHFMRALTSNQLKKEGYSIVKKGLAVKVEDYFHITLDKETTTYTVSLKEPVVIFRNGKQSRLECKSDKFYVDQYGNHTPIEKVIFSGHMGSQRLGDALPLDYKL